MQNYTNYIFDLDGTLIDTASMWLDIYRECLLSFGISPPDDASLALHTNDWKQMLDIGLSETDLAAFIKKASKAANDRLPRAKFHDGAIKLLEELHEHDKTIAIFSTTDRNVFERSMEHHGLHHFAAVAIAGDDVPHRKPHPSGLEEVFRRLNLTAAERSQAVYIGDKDTDIEAANNAKIDSILYYPTSHKKFYSLPVLTKHNPTHIIRHWDELTTRLAQLSRTSP